MLYLERAQKTIKSKTISLQQFLKLHLTVEGIFKRLIFIGLRINRVQYKTAQQAIGEYYQNDKKEIIKKAWNLCGFDYDKDVLSNNAYQTMEKLFNEFSARYRNKLIHGNDGALYDNELVKTLIQVDKKFIRSIELVLKTNGKPSLFEQPRAWNIEKSKNIDVDEVFKTLFKCNRRKNDNTPSIEEIKKQLLQIKL